MRLLKGVPTTRVIAGKITPERFIQEIAPLTEKDNAPNILVHSSELAVFLTKQQYGEPLINILTDLFDCPAEWAYRTKNRGEVVLKNLFVSIIAATTPDGISRGIPASALEEGFASRVLFVFQADTPKRNAMPELTLEEIELGEALRAELTTIGEMAGEFTLDGEAAEWFKDWYDNHNEPPLDKRMDGFFGRKHDHLLRIAMILAGAEQKYVIDYGQITAALSALEAVERLTPSALSDIGGDSMTPFVSRAITVMKGAKRISHSELLRKLKPIRADQFRQIVDTLVQSGYIKIDEERSGGMYDWIGDDE
jgi:hypothetical protein